jgi:molybdopterin synthase catalytic subunit
MDDYCKIPKIIFQTSRKKPEQYIIDMIKIQAPLWEYEHYTDEEIIDFFIKIH